MTLLISGLYGINDRKIDEYGAVGDMRIGIDNRPLAPLHRIRGSQLTAGNHELSLPKPPDLMHGTDQYLTIDNK
jgi:hypothetical protein